MWICDINNRLCLSVYTMHFTHSHTNFCDDTFSTKKNCCKFEIPALQFHSWTIVLRAKKKMKRRTIKHVAHVESNRKCKLYTIKQFAEAQFDVRMSNQAIQCVNFFNCYSCHRTYWACALAIELWYTLNIAIPQWNRGSMEVKEAVMKCAAN